MEVDVNYWAVLVAGLSSMVVGSVWYAKGVFGNTWAKLAHVDMDKAMKSSALALMMGSVFVMSLLTAYIIAHVAFLSNSFFGNSFLQDALTTAFWLWLGLTAARILTHDVFERRPAKLSALTLGNEFVTIVLMGLIIGYMGV